MTLSIAGYRNSSFASQKYSKAEKMKILDTYWKFTIMRSPLERLVSGYRDKLLSPSKKDMYRHFNMKSDILEKYNPDSETLDFKTYIKWIVDAPIELRRFRPSFQTHVHQQIPLHNPIPLLWKLQTHFIGHAQGDG